jgi:hypothetical protein
VLGVWLHTDEAYVHVHLAAVNDSDPQFRAARLHDGHRAQADARARGENRKHQSAAYCAAMRAWQDEVHREAGAFGLARLGPSRRRLTRDGWHAEKRALLAAAEARLHAEETLAEVARQREAVRSAAVKVARVLDEATKMRQQAEIAGRRDAETRRAYIQAVKQQQDTLNKRHAQLGSIAGQQARRSIGLAKREARMAAIEDKLLQASRVPAAILDNVLEILRHDLMRHPDRSVQEAAYRMHESIAAALAAPHAEAAGAVVTAEWQTLGAERDPQGP